MKFTLGWLREHLDTQASAAEIAEALTDLGLEVEGVEDPAETLDAFTICRVIEATQHPDADRLRLCRVEAWPNGPDQPGEEVQVVCGAPNARTGLVGVFAAPGTHVPGTGVDLKPGVIRGVESNGMLCSERELMISDDHQGIIDLPEDAPLGARYIDYADLNDPVIEIGVTPNRADALGVAGIARDLAARGLGRLVTPAVEPVAGGFPCPVSVTLSAEAQAGACPHFCARVIRGVTNGPSPDWMQRRLRAIGLRPISALVDVTNYITFDRARPLHVFDAAKVTGDLSVRFARPGESLLALDGKTYALDEGMTLVCDEAGPEGLGGVMGGEETGATGATTDVIIEAAWFDPVRTAATGRRLKIQSDARYRFERGVDPASARWGMELATRMILDLCGGEASAVFEAGAPIDLTRRYTLRPDRAAKLVGMEIAPETQRKTLEDLGFVVEAAADGFAVTPPSWRMDVGGEADLVEEAARIASLAGLRAEPLKRPSEGALAPALTPTQRRTARARRALAAAGMQECVTYSFVSEGAASAFGAAAGMALENPISSDLSHMRPSPLPGLAAAAARNQARGADGVALFEIGPGFDGPEPGQQRELAAGLRAGFTATRLWSGERRPVDLWDARADAEAALDAAGAPVEKLQLRRDAAPAWLHPGRSAALTLGPKTVLAVFGELHPKALAALDLKGPAAGFLVDLDAIPQPRAKTASRPALNANPLQPVTRDFAFVVNRQVEAGALTRAALSADKKLIEAAEVFDIYQGEGLGADEKSVALWVRMQPSGKSLTDAEIDAVAEKIVAAAAKSTGARLRG